MPRLSLAFAVATAALVADAAQAAFIQVTVDSHDGPWQYGGSLNPGYHYGVGDEAGPVVINAAAGFSFAPGGVFTIRYLSGSTTANAGAGFPYVDANGDTADATNGGPGTSGDYFPSRYFDPSTYPAYLSELVGTFADGQGNIVGTPFAIGDLDLVTVPAGATQLQLGINDEIYRDNSGSLLIAVSGPGVVPEPSSFALAMIGMAAVAGWRASRRPASGRPPSIT